MSARPPSPRSLRARGRATTASRGNSGTGRTTTTATTNTGVVGPALGAAVAVTAGTNDDEDELMTINENRNVGSGLGPSDTIHEPNANSSHSSSSSEAGSVHSDGEQHSVLLLDDGSGTSGRHPMDASACNACSLALENNNGFQVVEHERPLVNGCEDMWSWNKRDRSKEVWLSRSDNRRVYFHPNWSKGTAGIRGTRVLNNGRYYWEISLSQRVFGTSMMFGIGTKKARLHVNMFTNLLGEDRNGWGLSHKGLLWHGGVARNYTKRFKENQPTKIGLLFDGIAGTLTYYKDDVCLGIAFRGLNEVREPLYPIVCSTAAKTEMLLSETRRDFVNLQDRCRAIIIKHINTREKLDRLALPYFIKNYLAEAVTESNAAVTPLELHLIDQYLY
ncbi:SPRY domain-containing SOCS box protein 3 [Anopheles maculipalpis]|uniref:SPRY domain-containing SOCS box protein 3 n=1 Tax=Anopheles maculipalpis TaxID=1496333 RepID=UPI0021590F02|nr:SPRY domain-containing SOCS box protein 3 [Anopheles maculipalpis]XP_050077906.1 SPRY domain-containing SOCS box protein 3 [Anopheles maculipalpis]